MPNPILSWLRGDDLKMQDRIAQLERKLYFYEDVGAALTVRTHVWGGGLDYLNASHGTGNDGNSAVFACLMALAKGFTEPPVRAWVEQAPGDRSTIPDHKAVELIENPNPHMDGGELLFWTEWVKNVCGNAYWRKIRSGDPVTGNVIELWPISPLLIRPWRDKQSPNFIDAYKYQPKPGEQNAVYIEPENIVHFKLGMDDLDHRLGLSPLQRLLREVASDEEASKYTAALLANGAYPGLVVSTQDKTMTKEQAQDIKDSVKAKLGNDKRGDVVVLNNGAEIGQFGFSPDDLNMEALHNVPETRICSVLGVPPAIVGLGVGLKQTSNYASMREVREIFTENTLTWHWASSARKLNHQLLPDFTNDRRIKLGFDLSDVRAFQEDEDKKYTRLNIGVQGKWVTVNEARTDVGLPPIDGGDALQAAPVQPALPPGEKARTIELKAGSITAETLQALVDLAEPGLADDVADYMDSQRKRVKRALVSGG